MLTDTACYEYQLDNHFFSDLDTPEIQKGDFKVTLNVKKTSGIYQLDFHIDGVVIVTCDRCLDEMEQPVESFESLKVKLGDEFSEIDDIVVVPEDDGFINVAWFIYEFIILNLPLKHVHAPGKCNKEMTHKLKKHLRIEVDDENESADEYEELEEEE